MGYTGCENYASFCGRISNCKALFTSGYSADIFQQGELDESGYVFISKPLLLTELLHKIRQLLDE